MKSRILLATRSTHKAAEIQRILQRRDIALITLADAQIPETAEEDALEDAPTFLANALAKAVYFAQKSGIPTLADDSGLEVAALGNRPGVRTRRFALDHGYEGISGEELDRANHMLLLDIMKDIPEPQRAARYVCCATLVDERRTLCALGTAAGTVAFERRGENGFGYDPVFFLPELNQTFAELTPEQKDDRSHRAKAFRALASVIG